MYGNYSLSLVFLCSRISLLMDWGCRGCACVQRDLASLLTLDFRFLSLYASRSRSFSTVLCSKVRWLAGKSLAFGRRCSNGRARPSEDSFTWTLPFFNYSLPCVLKIPYRWPTRGWPDDHSLACCQRPEHLGVGMCSIRFLPGSKLRGYHAVFCVTAWATMHAFPVWKLRENWIH